MDRIYEIPKDEIDKLLHQDEHVCGVAKKVRRSRFQYTTFDFHHTDLHVF